MTRDLRGLVLAVAVMSGAAALGHAEVPTSGTPAALQTGAPAAPQTAAGSETAAPSPSAGCHAGGAFPPLDGDRRGLEVGGEARSYLIDAPGSAADAPLPVVLVFHGFRHDAAGLRSGSGFAELAAAGQLIAVHADGRTGVDLLGTTGRGWDTAPDDQRDVTFVRALLDEVERDRCVDRRRIYATGFSNGAFLANLLGCRLADRLAAVAAVSGARALDRCAPAAPLPVLFFHGTADKVVPVGLTAAARSWWRATNHCDETGEEPRDGCVAARGCAADVVYCEHPFAHTWPPTATARMWRFFREHPRR